jgi:hypothetical protein
MSWNAYVMARIIRQIVAHRLLYSQSKEGLKVVVDKNRPTILSEDGRLVIDEVKEVIELPDFDLLTADYRHEE